MSLELSKYENLPDYMEPEELRDYFRDLFLLHKVESESNPLIFAKVLIQLSDRQWHTYEFIDLKTKNQIEEWIAKNLQTHQLSLIKKICSIISTLGLTNSFNMLKNNLKYYNDMEIKDYLNNFFKKNDSDVSDPYRSLRNK